MYDSLELFSAFGNVVFGALLLVAFAATYGLAAWRGVARVRALIAGLIAASSLAVALIASSAQALHVLGDAAAEVERADATRVVWLRRWTKHQQRLIARASLSPAHRATVRRLFERPLRFEEPFPPRDARSLARLRAWSRSHGECALDVILDRRARGLQTRRVERVHPPWGRA